MDLIYIAALLTTICFGGSSDDKEEQLTYICCMKDIGSTLDPEKFEDVIKCFWKDCPKEYTKTGETQSCLDKNLGEACKQGEPTGTFTKEPTPAPTPRPKKGKGKGK